MMTVLVLSVELAEGPLENSWKRKLKIKLCHPSNAYHSSSCPIFTHLSNLPPSVLAVSVFSFRPPTCLLYPADAFVFLYKNEKTYSSSTFTRAHPLPMLRSPGMKTINESFVVPLFDQTTDLFPPGSSSTKKGRQQDMGIATQRWYRQPRQEVSGVAKIEWTTSVLQNEPWSKLWIHACLSSKLAYK